MTTHTFRRATPQALALSMATLLAACGSSDNPAPSSLAREKAALCGETAVSGTLAPTCTTPASRDGLEPSCNPHLAQDAWSASHRGNFAQASSPLPGVTDTPDRVNVDHQSTQSVPIVLNFSEPDAQGKRAVWASTVASQGQIFKLDAETLRPIQTILGGNSNFGAGASGAYNLLDRDQRLIVGQADRLRVFGDATPGDRHSGIADLKDFKIPASALCRPSEDSLVGITMLPDGHVAFATKLGQVGVVPRYPEAMCEASLATYSINGDACGDSSKATDTLEQVSNSIAADEQGNVYVVTSAAQYKLNWNGRQLALGWRAGYPGAGGSGAGRLGGGSGSTPTLMGTQAGDDRFVVITDGRPLMHLLLLWRDEIPAGWKPPSADLDPRVACSIPVDFGNPEATESLSEQSVLVRGYASVIVNNQLQLNRVLSAVPPRLQPFNQLSSGLAINRPKGLQRIDWDPATRRCRSVWANAEISIPNGIPTMSAESQQIFGIGSRTLNGIDTWTLESVDFRTGTSLFTVPAGPQPTENSFYAATTIGPDNSVWTGTFGGVTRYRNCLARDAQCGRRPNPLTPLTLAR